MGLTFYNQKFLPQAVPFHCVVAEHKHTELLQTKFQLLLHKIVGSHVSLWSNLGT